jgi:citrate synthase
MTMLSIAILSLQAQSKFYKAYHSGAKKSEYWTYYYEDTMDLLAKIPSIAAIIYRHLYKNGDIIKPDLTLDWAGNFAHMLGFTDNQVKECMRGYMSMHADHEGYNVSAHTSMLVGSALSDPYLSYSAALNGLAGPLHGLASQECLKWYTTLQDYHQGQSPNPLII